MNTQIKTNLSRIGKRYCGCCKFEILAKEQAFKDQDYGQVCPECKTQIDYLDTDPPVPFFLYCRNVGCYNKLDKDRQFNKDGRCEKCLN